MQILTHHRNPKPWLEDPRWNQGKRRNNIIMITGFLLALVMIAFMMYDGYWSATPPGEVNRSTQYVWVSLTSSSTASSWTTNSIPSTLTTGATRYRYRVFCPATSKHSYGYRAVDSAGDRSTRLRMTRRTLSLVQKACISYLH